MCCGVSSQFREEAEPTGGVATAEYEADRNDKPMGPDVGVSCRDVGALPGTVKGCSDVILIEKDVLL